MARMNDDDLLELAPGAPLRGTAYRVTRKLGAGGMGAVYEGEHIRLKRRVCIKIIHPGMRGRDEFLARMEREAQTLARLDHPGIVKVFDLGVTDEGIPYFVMERLEGKDLRRLLRSRRFFALPDALAIMKDVLEALAHAHTEGIVHRDIKPENVFLALSGADAVTKVLDFGIAHVTDDPRVLTGQRFLGTCQYAAPEQLQGEKPTERTDIYAAGCMLFELVAGRRPHPGPTANDFIRQHLKEPAPLLSTFVPVPAALDELVANALAKDPSRRPISALWFAAQLHQLGQIADDVVLASANTTEEMLLTAVTSGADSSSKLALANDTVRDAALPLAMDATAPEEAARGRKADTVRLALETAPLDMRMVGTREAPAVARLRTEELSAEEHEELEGRPREDHGISKPESDRERAASRPSGGATSTGGAAPVEVPLRSTPRHRAASSRRRALIIASPVVGGLCIAIAILVVGLRRDGSAIIASPSAVASPSVVAAPSSSPASAVAATPAPDVVPRAATSASSRADALPSSASGAREGALLRGHGRGLASGDVGRVPEGPFVPATPSARVAPSAPSTASSSPEPSSPRRDDFVRSL